MSTRILFLCVVLSGLVTGCAKTEPDNYFDLLPNDIQEIFYGSEDGNSPIISRSRRYPFDQLTLPADVSFVGTYYQRGRRNTAAFKLADADAEASFHEALLEQGWHHHDPPAAGFSFPPGPATQFHHDDFGTLDVTAGRMNYLTARSHDQYCRQPREPEKLAQGHLPLLYLNNIAGFSNRQTVNGFRDGMMSIELSSPGLDVESTYADFASQLTAAGWRLQESDSIGDGLVSHWRREVEGDVLEAVFEIEPAEFHIRAEFSFKVTESA